MISIDFSHIYEQMSDPICVFWNNEKEAWSNMGCRVVKSSKAQTTCECNHLTHFALLMKYPDGMDMTKIGSGIIFSSDGYSNNNNKGGDSGTTIITLEIATYIISTVCLIILILLVIQVRASRQHMFILIAKD